MKSPESARVPRVLVVDDDDGVRVITSRTLQEAGYEVAEAADGLQALAIVAGGEQVDVVVTDVRMPRMSGYDLAAQLAAKYPQLCVLLVSGYDFKAGHHPWPVLPKPFRADQLTDCLQQLLERAQRSA